MWKGCASVLAILAIGATCPGETVEITPSIDNTIYENATGQLSNGAGQFIWTGVNNAGIRRRALIRFAIGDHVPEGSIVQSVELSMNMSRAPGDSPFSVALHLVRKNWGEGTSDASGNEGEGAPSSTGDATWLHTFFDTEFWALEGGDFDPDPSAASTVGPVGPYVWASTGRLVADAQSWLDDPAANFGWIVIGDEDQGGTAKRFDSRENPAADQVPKLTVVFTPPTFVERNHWVAYD